MSTLHIRLLGDFDLSYGDEPLTAIKRRQQVLLAYLLLHRQAPQSRQQLAFLFWPDTSEAQALTNLRNLLHKLRQSLPQAGRFLQADAQTVQWRPDASFELDVAAFEALAGRTTAADLQQAVKLYRGDLLPGCFDDWLLPERTRLSQMAMAALERLVGLLEERREYGAALSYAEQLVQLDPLNEATYRALMRLHAANSDRAGALSAYHTCVRTLRREIAADPSPETLALYKRLSSMAAAPPSPTGVIQDQPPFVGRQREWKQMHDAWSAARNGKPCCIILTGEAGIGKTRLAEEMVSWTSRQGLDTAVAHCYAAEGALPYAPVATWLHAAAMRKRLPSLDAVWLTEVARLSPELLTEHPRLSRPGPLTQDWQRQRLFEALARGMAGQDEPLLLFLDDLQWCDSDTLEWLHYLLRFKPGARLLVIGTVRTEDVAYSPALTSLLSVLRQAGQVIELALSPLDAAETASLAAHMVGQTLTPRQHARLYAETEGNPLFVVEMIRSGVELSEPPAASPWQDSNLSALPPKVHAVLHSRLAGLSPDARELCGLAATVGREFTFPVLAYASDHEENTLVRCLDELWQRRIVREHGADAYDFTHDKLRETAYTSLSAARRRLLHRRVAQALEIVYADALDTVSGLAATHYELAGLYDQAIPYYQRAAELARRVHANADAIRFYRRALALMEGPAGRSPELSAQLYEQVADILHFTGRYEEARAAYARSLAQAPGLAITRARLHRKLGNAWREQYCYSEAGQAYADAERILTVSPSLSQPDADKVLQAVTRPAEHAPEWWQERIQVMLDMNAVNYWIGEVERGDDLRLKLRPAVEQHGSPAQRAAFFLSSMMIDFRRSRSIASDETVGLARAAWAAVRESGNEANVPSALFQLGFILLWHGDPHEALEPLHSALRLAQETADITLQARCLTYLAIAQRQCGQVNAAEQFAARALAVAGDAHMPEYAGTARANQAWVEWRRGDSQSAGLHGRAALASWHELPAGHASTPFQWTALWPLIAVALHEDQLSAAVEHARCLLDPTQQRIPDALAALLEQAIQAWQQNEIEMTRSLLQQAAVIAQQMHYL